VNKRIEDIKSRGRKEVVTENICQHLSSTAYVLVQLKKLKITTQDNNQRQFKV
jgi:hypothetical protein